MFSSQLLCNIVIIVGVVLVLTTSVKSTDQNAQQDRSDGHIVIALLGHGGQQQDGSGHKRENVQEGDTKSAMLNAMMKSLENMEKRLAAMESNPKGAGGVQYVRWGKTRCPYNTELVYKGRIGGEHYKNSGGGANYVCLPDKPKYARFSYNKGRYAAYMYGTEYELNFNPFLRSKYWLYNYEVPCAVCYVTTRNSQLMIPATNECPAQWTLEYHGYLMANHRKFHRTEFICVDNDAEGAGSGQDHDGALLYPVVGKCGTLQCSPYIDDAQMTCVVCTR